MLSTALGGDQSKRHGMLVHILVWGKQRGFLLVCSPTACLSSVSVERF